MNDASEKDRNAFLVENGVDLDSRWDAGVSGGGAAAQRTSTTLGVASRGSGDMDGGESANSGKVRWTKRKPLAPEGPGGAMQGNSSKQLRGCDAMAQSTAVADMPDLD